MATKAVLKGHFNTGDTPTEAQFASFIDSYPSFDDDFAPKYKKVSVSSAEILALNTTPKELVAAPGAGKVILLTSILINYTFVTSAYATNTNIVVENRTSGTEQFNNSGFGLLSNLSSIIHYYGAPELFGIIEENEAIDLTIQNGNPTAGDSTLDIHLWYSEVTL